MFVLWFIFSIALFLYGIVLYCCLRISTAYDDAVDDEQQEVYLKSLQ